MDKDEFRKITNSKLEVFFKTLHNLKNRKTGSKSDLFIIGTLDRLSDSIKSAILLNDNNFHLDAACICRIIIEHLFLLGAAILTKNADEFYLKLKKSYLKDRLKMCKVRYLTSAEDEKEIIKEVNTIIDKVLSNNQKEIKDYAELSKLCQMSNIYTMYYVYLSSILHANTRSITDKIIQKSGNEIGWRSDFKDDSNLVDEIIFNVVRIINSILKFKFDDTIEESSFADLLDKFKKESKLIDEKQVLWSNYEKDAHSKGQKALNVKKNAQKDKKT